jgi:hypothetical protein
MDIHLLLWEVDLAKRRLASLFSNDSTPACTCSHDFARSERGRTSSPAAAGGGELASGCLDDSEFACNAKSRANRF